MDFNFWEKKWQFTPLTQLLAPIQSGSQMQSVNQSHPENHSFVDQLMQLAVTTLSTGIAPINKRTFFSFGTHAFRIIERNYNDDDRRRHGICPHIYLHTYISVGKVRILRCFRTSNV